jgi:hypothetical protein
MAFCAFGVGGDALGHALYPSSVDPVVAPSDNDPTNRLF